MVCACLVTIRPLIMKLLPSLFPATNNLPSSVPVKSGSWGDRFSSKFSSSKNGIELQSMDDLNKETAVSGTILEIRKTTNFEMKEEVDSILAGEGGNRGKRLGDAEFGLGSVQHQV